MIPGLRTLLQRQCEEYWRRCEIPFQGVADILREEQDYTSNIAFTQFGTYQNFLLSDYKRARQDLTLFMRAQAEPRERSEDDREYYERISVLAHCDYISVYLTYGDEAFLVKHIDAFLQYLKTSARKLRPNIERTVALVFMGHASLLPRILKKNIKYFEWQIERIGIPTVALEPSKRLQQAEHAFWIGDREGLREYAKGLRSQVNRIPAWAFESGAFLHSPDFTKQFYLHFSDFCEEMSKPQYDPERLQALALRMILSEFEIKTMPGCLTAKYFDIIAQMLAGHVRDEANLRYYFPELSAFLQNVAGNYG